MHWKCSTSKPLNASLRNRWESFAAVAHEVKKRGRKERLPQCRHDHVPDRAHQHAKTHAKEIKLKKSGATNYRETNANQQQPACCERIIGGKVLHRTRATEQRPTNDRITLYRHPSKTNNNALRRPMGETELAHGV